MGTIFAWTCRSTPKSNTVPAQSVCHYCNGIAKFYESIYIHTYIQLYILGCCDMEVSGWITLSTSIWTSHVYALLDNYPHRPLTQVMRWMLYMEVIHKLISIPVYLVYMSLAMIYPCLVILLSIWLVGNRLLDVCVCVYIYIYSKVSGVARACLGTVVWSGWLELASGHAKNTGKGHHQWVMGYKLPISDRQVAACCVTEP